MGTRRALETDWVDWTPEQLERRIHETERLLDRIAANPADPIDEGFRSIREMLNADLADKQGRLVRSRRGSAS